MYGKLALHILLGRLAKSEISGYVVIENKRRIKKYGNELY